MSEFEALKPEDRGDFKARLLDACPPSWARADVDMSPTQAPPPPDEDNDDVERHPAASGGIRGLDDAYIQKNRMPPIKVCLWYNPLMYMSPSATRSEWEQQLGGFPAFFIYTMSRSIYSSATNPLLKPEYFMPEAKPMTTHARYSLSLSLFLHDVWFNKRGSPDIVLTCIFFRWHEHMDDGDNPLAGYCVAGWACRQFGRVMDASKQSVNVSEMCKVIFQSQHCLFRYGC